MPEIKISSGYSNRLTISFQYRPYLVAKIKAIEGHRWHPKEKLWSLPYSKSILKTLIKVFENENIHVDPAIIADHLEIFSGNISLKNEFE